VNIDLAPEALEFGIQSARAFEAAGADDWVERAELDPAARVALVAPTLEQLGAWDLDPVASTEELEAAAALCRAAGYRMVPYPVAQRLAAPTGRDLDGLLVVAGPRPAAPIEGVDLRWAAARLDGTAARATARSSTTSARTSAFVVPLDLEPIDDVTTADVARALVLPCWTLLGMLDRAMDLTCAYVQDRHQFGQALSGFQSVQFQLTDAEVERSGVEQLARYALWSIETGRPEVLEDAVALRLAAIEAADVVFRITHQLHGAIGFCDETALSWISRHSQPLRRLPLDRSATEEALGGLLGRHGLTGLFHGTAVWQ
jgi:hypothetical protein